MFSDECLRPYHNLVMHEINESTTARIASLEEKLNEYCVKATEIIDTQKC